MTRRDIILHDIDLAAGPGLELGPLTAPVVKRSDAEVYYVDHLSAPDLKRKYANEPVDPAHIVNVDYVLGSSSLSEVVAGKKFKYIVAAHVIEHVPDTVRWFKDIAEVLEPNGVLSLVIPDKRYTFDIARNDSRPADILGAYLDAHRRTPTTSMYDFASEYRDGIDPLEIWKTPNFDSTGARRRYSMDEAWEMCQENAHTDNYVDAHCHVFTPHSFMEILRALAKRELLDFEVAYFFETNENNIEFYVSLRKLNAGEKNLERQLDSIPEVSAPETVVELRRRIEKLEAEMAVLNSSIAGIYDSKSWKVTRPLRGASRLVKRRYAR